MPPKLIIEVVGDTSSLEKSFRKSSQASSRWGREMERAGRGATAATLGFKGLGRSVGFASASFLGGAGFVSVARDSVSAASDLSEEINKSRVVFGDSSAQVLAWSKQSATAFGLARQQALAAAGGFGAMLETSGVAARQAAGMSEQLVKLSADMASFNNQDPTEMLDKLRSGLSGEAEPLRRFGVLLSEGRVKAEAYRTGIAKAGTVLTEQQKVQARYAIILRDTTKQQGDFARTSDGLANKQRTLRAALTDTEATVGKALLPTVVKVTSGLSDWFSKTENQQRIQGDVTEALKISETVIHDVGESWKFVSDMLGGSKNALRDFAAVYATFKVAKLATDVRKLGLAWGLVATNETRATGAGAGAAGGAAAGGGAALAGAGLLKLIAGGFGASPDQRTLAPAPPGYFRDIEGKLHKQPGGLPTLSKLPANAFQGLFSGLLGDPLAGLAAAFAGRGKAAPAAAGTQTPFLTYKLAIEEARKGNAGDENVLRKIISVLRTRAGATKNLAAKTEIQQAINQYQSQLSGLLDEDAQVVKDHAALVEKNRKDVAAKEKAEHDKAVTKALKALAANRTRNRKLLERSQTFIIPTSLLVDQAKADALGTGGKSIARKIKEAAEAALASGRLAAAGQIAAWDAIRDANNELAQDTDKQTRIFGHKASPRSLLKGLGLSAEETRAVAARLARVSPSGIVPSSGGGAFGVPIIVNSTLEVDGQKMATNTTKHQQVRARRNPPQKRGVIRYGI